MCLNALYLRNINTDDFHLEECDLHIIDIRYYQSIQREKDSHKL
jgi:hypothetical protein